MKKFFTPLLLVPFLAAGANFDPLVSTKTLSNYNHNVYLNQNLILGGSTNVAEALAEVTARQFLPTAEQFGAVPDGVTDCYQAITNCLTTYNECYLRPGTYITSQAIMLQSNQKLIGTDKTVTTIKLQDNCAQYNSRAAGSKYDGIIRYTYPGNQTNIVVADLTLDANYLNQMTGVGPYASNTICGIILNGTGQRVSSVRVLNVGSGHTDHVVDYQECFAVNITGFASLAGATNANIIENCEVAFTQEYQGGLGDYSFIVMHNDNSASIMRNNYVHDIPNSTLIPNNLIALTATGNGVICEGNIVNNFLGRGYFADTYTNSNVKIIGNHFNGTIHGMYFGGSAHWTNLSIVGNSWENPRNIPAGFTYPSTTLDVDTYQYPSAILFRFVSTLDGVDITANTFTANQWTDRGSGGQEAGPIIVFYPSAAYNWTNIYVRDNLLAQHSATDHTAEVHRGSWWLTDYANMPDGVVRWSNNRNARGGLQPLLARLWLAPETRTKFEDASLLMLRTWAPWIPTNHGQLWYNYTNRSLMFSDDYGQQRILSTTNADFTGDIMVLTLGGGSNLLQYSLGKVTNSTQFP